MRAVQVQSCQRSFAPGTCRALCGGDVLCVLYAGLALAEDCDQIQQERSSKLQLVPSKHDSACQHASQQLT